MGNTILAKGVNHILAKRDNSAWPKGSKLSGFSNAKEFVHELRTGSWMDSDCTDEQYMCNFAERYVIQAGVRIATDTPEHFLSDLIRTGYAKEI